jgi:hypothetical protein
MGFILVLGVLSLAIFVCISDTVFNIVAGMRSISRPRELQTKK